MRERLRFQVGPTRPPRVTDDDNDGLAGAPVPKRPYPVTFSGGAARPIPRNADAKTTELVALAGAEDTAKNAISHQPVFMMEVAARVDRAFELL